ncbi:MAG: nucleotide-diphospho-sugar transferase [Flavobacteriales bacterium]|nr:nucleotide-diphospho-sugar transferase [Flavobacteriales bacterium]
MSQTKHAGSFNTPVLLIAFNRYGPARKVLEAIRAVRPPRLYFACDGPRNAMENEACEKVRSLVRSVDWPCEVFTRYSPVNLGVRHGEAQAMSWFFEHEEEGIVLEDDTLPVPGFFWFCQEMLERYRSDERIWCIMGNNLMPEWRSRDKSSYWFSAHGYGAYWGWAGWRRVWRHYDVDMRDWPAIRKEGLLDGHFLSRGERAEALKLFDYTYLGRIRSWDYQFDLARILNHGITVLPSNNLVLNIGFGPDGTHTINENDPRNKRDAKDLDFPLVHPKYILPEGTRDRAYFERYIRPSLWRRMKYVVKRMVDPALSRDLEKAGRS